MSRHREEMEAKYSEFLKQELLKEEQLAELGELNILKIHGMLMGLFGETLTVDTVRRQLRRVIEGITASMEEDE